MDVSLLGQYLINGAMLGVMYALVAVGFTLFFGVLDIIKFSHGDVLTVGAFTGLYVTKDNLLEAWKEVYHTEAPDTIKKSMK